MNILVICNDTYIYCNEILRHNCLKLLFEVLAKQKKVCLNVREYMTPNQCVMAFCLKSFETMSGSLEIVQGYKDFSVQFSLVVRFLLFFIQHYLNSIIDERNWEK